MMEDLLGYRGQKAVVTGAASGMGAAATELLLGLGAEVLTGQRDNLVGLSCWMRPDRPGSMAIETRDNPA